jgi:hypothetical protein
MTAFNIVRMRVKPGAIEDFLAVHRERLLSDMPGMTALNVVKTGERDFCIVGEWSGMEALAAARPKMVGILDSFRDKLEDLGGGLGVTDPVSGEAVVSRRG